MSRYLIAAAIAAAALGAAPAEAQLAPKNACGDCHFAHPEAPAQSHLLDWSTSPHGRNNVNCEKCHGGNPTTFESLPAHAGILDADNVKSPVNRRNLPATCGKCHAGPFVAFQESRHYELLQSGKENGPTCSTCHETVAGRLLKPKVLESRCNSCHGINEIAPRPGRPQMARQLYEQLATLRLDFTAAQKSIKKVRDPARRMMLLDAYGQAEVPLIRAVNAGHQFVYDDLREYTAVAQRRIDALLMTIDSQETR